ncbi:MULTISPECIES: GAF domain-containing protein [Staphylococcus]|uniref:GAF domain-containing protein n=1 Tax=Staphylococcus TaxID=1279 RepID=UPI0002F5FF6A|nr:MULTISPECIES: GAF domain-containing protein [Staphylococcus]MBM6507586.1 GAF domain-containing protein [Staphylococcus pasteuri]MCE3021812.1 GAF domain-containing protein [Staphylococcus pasteuri]PTU83560.1 GAF domain-containing protein [Staphylococcus pasteuri]PTU84608.1 GAF domain-containing protein [Staphylococcus pasteuri]QQT20671.1 GAF domain-containing protein [Staphylococcus pasteuri]
MIDIKNTNYDLLQKQLSSLIEDESNLIAILSNASALINDNMDKVNWVGFYLIEENELILGPFQGHPACVHIQIGKGVCGTAVSTNETQVVKDVHQFPGHIACDANSNSEIVVPIHKDGKIIGVLDIDAPIKNRFNDQDRIGLEKIVSIIENQI